jgi:hypothetical protein
MFVKWISVLTKQAHHALPRIYHEITLGLYAIFLSLWYINVLLCIPCLKLKLKFFCHHDFYKHIFVFPP